MTDQFHGIHFIIQKNGIVDMCGVVLVSKMGEVLFKSVVAFKRIRYFVCFMNQVSQVLILKH